MKPRINDGTRASRLQLGRHQSGEQALDAEATATPEAARWLAEVAAAEPPPFDAEALRRRAAGLDRASEPENVVPLFRRVLPYVGATLAMAAAAMLAVNVPTHEPVNRTKGQTELGFYVFRDGEAFPGTPNDAVRAGDQVQFTYHPGGFDRLVVVGIDGSGTTQVYFPEPGEAALAVVPGEQHVLEGSILLDDAPGPEIFVAFFDGGTTDQATREVQLAWNAGGVRAVEELDRSRDDMAILVLDKE